MAEGRPRPQARAQPELHLVPPFLTALAGAKGAFLPFACKGALLWPLGAAEPAAGSKPHAPASAPTGPWSWAPVWDSRWPVEPLLFFCFVPAAILCPPASRASATTPPGATPLEKNRQSPDGIEQPQLADSTGY